MNTVEVEFRKVKALETIASELKEIHKELDAIRKTKNIEVGLSTVNEEREDKPF